MKTRERKKKQGKEKQAAKARFCHVTPAKQQSPPPHVGDCLIIGNRRDKVDEVRRSSHHGWSGPRDPLIKKALPTIRIVRGS